MRIYEGTLVMNQDILVSYSTAHMHLPFDDTGIAVAGASETTPSSVATFTATTGRPAELAVVFFDNSSWTAFSSSIAVYQGIWNGRNCCWSIPLVPDGGAFADVISGSRNSIFTSCANAVLAAAPPGTKIITRIGWEFNGNWFGWAAGGGQEANYVAAFNHVVGLFRAVSSRFIFDLGINIVSAGPACNIDAVVNGVKANLTFLGNDCYFSSGDSTANGGADNFGFHRTKTWGLEATRTAALANGLRHSIPECAGPDSVPNYGRDLLQWILENEPAYWGWWEGDHGPLNMRLATGVNPLTLQEYRVRFGDPGFSVVATQGAIALSGQNATLTASAASSWPDSTNTGTTGTLTSSSGITATSNGQVIQNLNVAGTIRVDDTFSNVIIRNCRAQAIEIWGGPLCLVEDCTIVGTGNNTGIDFSSPGGMCRRNNISNVENQIAIGAINGSFSGQTTTIRDNYGHDNFSVSGEPHYDAITLQGGQSNILIEHNFFTGSGLSATVFIQNDNGPITNITVNNNKLFGGAYICYAYPKNGPVSGIHYTNNRMDNWFYGPLFSPYTIATWSGNVVDSTSASIPLA